MYSDSIKPQPGNAKDPKNFVGRVATSNRARQLLQAGNNLLLTDLRRMGKTFWMIRFKDTETAFQAYLIDYEGVSTREEFLIKTAKSLSEEQKLPERVRNFLSTLFTHVDEVNLTGVVKLKTNQHPTPPLSLLAEVLKSLESTENDLIPLILMDEVPMAVSLIAENEGKTAAKELLQTLRGLRQGTKRVRWIVTGSIGFHHVIKAAGATRGDIADLEPLHLGPMPEPEAIELAEKLIRGIGHTPTEDITSELIKVSGRIPNLMHMVLSVVEDQNKGVTPQDIREAFEDMIDDPHRFQQLAHFDERVELLYKKNKKLVNKVLEITSVTPHEEWTQIDSLPRQSSLEEVIDLLCCDHYLERKGHSVRWRYPAYAYIWARKHNLLGRP